MNLEKRVEKLEQAEIFTGPRSLLTQLQVALNGASLRITGKLFSAPCDQPIQELIFADLEDRFIRNLSDADLHSLAVELGRIAYGDDTAALEAAWREYTGKEATFESAGRTFEKIKAERVEVPA